MLTLVGILAALGPTRGKHWTEQPAVTGMVVMVMDCLGSRNLSQHCRADVTIANLYISTFLSLPFISSSLLLLFLLNRLRRLSLTAPYVAVTFTHVGFI